MVTAHKGKLLDKRVYQATEKARVDEHVAILRTAYTVPVSVRVFKRVARADDVTIPIFVIIVREA